MDYDYFLSSFLAVFVLTTNENYPSVTYAVKSPQFPAVPFLPLSSCRMCAHVHMRPHLRAQTPRTSLKMAPRALC